jgi:hypothetical protein
MRVGFLLVGDRRAGLGGILNTLIKQWLFEKPSEFSDGRKTALEPCASTTVPEFKEEE